MFELERYHGDRFNRVNAMVRELEGELTRKINLVGSATLPLPEVCQSASLPAVAVRVEGHLDARIFPGTRPIDMAEEIIEDATRRLFGLDDGYAINAQPHSATQANHAIIRATVPRGGTVAAIAAVDGGHISHRFGVPEGTDFVTIPADQTGIDYSGVCRVIEERRPDLLIVGGSSYARSIDFARLKRSIGKVSCVLHADLAHSAPFVASGLHSPAFPFVDSATIDLGKNLRGNGGALLVYRTEIAKQVRRAVFPIIQSSPNQLLLVTKATCLASWTSSELKDYAAALQDNARTMDETIRQALGAPVYGGTDSHLLLYRVPAEMTGQQAEVLLESQGILANRNQVPGDARSHIRPSGLRLSSTVPTILKYTSHDLQRLAGAVVSALRSEACEAEVEGLLSKYHKSLVQYRQ